MYRFNLDDKWGALFALILLSVILIPSVLSTNAHDAVSDDPGPHGVRSSSANHTFDIPVHLGYNLISVPLVQNDTSILVVLDDDGGDTIWEYALWYNATDINDHWKTFGTFKPPVLNDLNEVNHTMGIILNITDVGSDSLLTVRGDLPTITTIPLYEGKNLVGYPALNESMTVADVKAATGGRVTSVQNRSEVPYPDDYVLKRGEGYWFNVSENCSWTIPDMTLTFDIPVQLGYNLISVPLVQNDTSILAVLDDDGGDTIWEYALWYNATDTNDHWKTFGTFKPPVLNDLNEVDHTMGIVLNVTDVGSDGYLTVRGTLPTNTTIPLFEGKNLVGYPSLNESMTVADVKAATGGRVTSVQNRSEVPYPDAYVLKRGEGYWFNVSENCSWTLNDPIPGDPVAHIKPAYQEMSVGEAVNFDGSQSYDPDGIIVSHSWDFGDGDTGTGSITSHAYASPDNYTVTLTVTDNDGLTDNDTCVVEVRDGLAPVISNVVVIPSTPTNRQTITAMCNVTDDVGVAHVNITYLHNGTTWVDAPMADNETSLYQAIFGPVNQNSTFFINATDTSGNSASLNDNITVRKPLIEATTEGLEPGQNLGTGSQVRITGMVHIDGEPSATGLHVVAFLNGEEVGRCQVFENGSYLLEFVLPDMSSGENLLEIQLVDTVGGEVLQLESMVLRVSSPFPYLPILLGAAITIPFVVALFTEVGKYALLLLIVPLYSKLKKDEVLDLYMRGKIHGYILANPGDHYNSIRRALKINNGALAYHLRVLEKEDIIKSKVSGMYKRFYPWEMTVPNGGLDELSEVQRLIMDKIGETPGITQKEIARLLGLSPSTINYHINKLMDFNAVRMERKGKWAKYYRIPEPESTAGEKDNT